MWELLKRRNLETQLRNSSGRCFLRAEPSAARPCQQNSIFKLKGINVYFMVYCVADELHHRLMNECRKVADLQQELQGVATNCLSVRELQEQIRDIQVHIELRIIKNMICGD
jgi:hypothetical protein